jgi:hypothetical protein
MLVGWLGGLLEKMSGSAFWLLHAGLVFVAAVVLMTVRFTVGRSLAPAYGAPSRSPSQ